MITCDIGFARKFIKDDEYLKARRKADMALDQLKNKTGPGSEWLGWRDLLADPNDAEIEEISSLGEEVREKADIFIVCGIGGSYLGAKAVIEALTPHFGSKGPEILFAGHHIGGKYLEELMAYLKEPKEDGSPKNIYVNVISKSGSTLETALSFRLLRELIEDLYGDDASEHIICTTSKEGGLLNKVIKEKGYRKFIIPDDVGGRYSVLTPVGLLPIAVAGIDVRTLLYGAVSAYNRYKENTEDILEYAALRNAIHETGKTIDVFATFEPELSSFGGWIQQLLGESEGKEGQGIFPTVATYSTDLHSLGQFIQQGQRSLMETFIIVEKPFSDLEVNELEGNDDELNYLAGKSFHEINTKAREGTIEAHSEGDVPIVKICLSALNAENIGELIYFFELLTGIFVYSLGVNPFNQPGVEDYKKAMYRLLGKH
ncbi:glucose-6-phosphate isomerase [Gracilimonas mengyeensis]|uniref:Glucose-6-phosphate isomerase n=1 Tax=Gracilimonas mengyeensis TaxID=1302730 RepID=A0A521DV71_9BACT|nr:glucose-6-phosphate isomerase [Gracilimonas mengyeensis]SMO74730.1 glucose-6-phosphate isomerase [Gracilimonas mengyeensis]